MVRTHYVPVDASVFRNIFKETPILYGGKFDEDISVFRPDQTYIRGSGWFTRIALPYFRKHIVPNLIEFGSNVLGDINSGQSAKTSAKRRGLESLKKTTKKIMSGGVKRKKFKKKRIVKRKNIYKPKLYGPGKKKSVKKKEKKKKTF